MFDNIPSSICRVYLPLVGSRGPVGRAEDQRSRGLGFHSRHWSLGGALGKLILHCLCPPSSNGYLVHESKVGSTCAECALVAAPCQGVKSRLKMLEALIANYKLVPLPLPSSPVSFLCLHSLHPFTFVLAFHLLSHLAPPFRLLSLAHLIPLSTSYAYTTSIFFLGLPLTIESFLCFY